MSYKHEYFVENIIINNINKTIKKYISEYKKKYIRFIFDCRINSVIDEFNKKNKVNLYIIIYSHKEDATPNHYILSCPKPMIEIKMLKILEAIPMLIKSLGRYLYPIPLVEFIILKYWGYIDNKKKLVHDYNWYEFPPKHPSGELLEIMRSCEISFLILYLNQLLLVTLYLLFLQE